MKLLENTTSHAQADRERFPRDRPAAAHVRQLLVALKILDIGALTAGLRNAQLQFDTRSFMLDILIPALQETGHEVAAKRLDIFHEHAFSALARSVLSGLLHATMDRSPEGAIVFAAPEGELHEFAILIAAILASLNGFSVFYLGPNVPAASVIKAVNAVNARLCVLGVSAPPEALPGAELKKFLSAVARGLPKDTPLWLGGGRCAGTLPATLRAKDKILPRLSDFERELRLATLPK
ncbi:MAG: hypothetical protein HC902_06715 [Calothrix sp. SM1_5_4]|nr:hypothetical protein [Calothrix sp. SM1_5_4]